MRCPVHNDTELEFRSGDFPTGIRAPDGYQEMAYDEWYWCYKGTHRFSPEDLEDDDLRYDPDHLNPAEGGNRAADDYWSER
jgi:hypothetical protein